MAWRELALVSLTFYSELLQTKGKPTYPSHSAAVVEEQDCLPERYSAGWPPLWSLSFSSGSLFPVSPIIEPIRANTEVLCHLHV